MKILVLSYQDSGGGCGKLARAINEHPKHTAKAARWRKGRLDYKVGFPVIWQPDRARTINLIKWCDAIIVTGQWRKTMKRVGDWGNTVIPPGAPRRPMVVNYRGTPYRQNRDDFNTYDRSRDIIQTGNFIDLLLYGNIKHWLPVPVWADELEQRYRKPVGGSVLRVVQAVTLPRRFPLKKTNQVRKALRNMTNVVFNPITKVTNDECLKRIGKSDLVVTAFKNGPGNAGLEAMAMGIPIIADGFPKYITKVKRLTGGLFFCKSNLQNLRAVVAKFRDDKEFYNAWSQCGYDYVREFHAPRVVAEKAIKLCQMAKPARY